MLKNIYIMSTVMTLSLFFGCANSTDVKVAENKNVKYQPMKMNNIPPVPKQESIIKIIEIDKADIEKYEKEQEQMSDFEKMMASRERRLRKK